MSQVRSQLSKIDDYPAFLEMMWKKHLELRRENAPTIISTFAGCGGSSLGYSMAGFRELLVVEWNDNAVATFELNFPDIPVYHGDIKKLSVDKCLELAGLEPGQLDVLDGSPPCQGFSTAGKRDMDDDRNKLYMEYIRLLRGLKPKVFIIENVSGLVKGKMKLIFAEIMRELKASRYRVSCRLLNAKWFGVPQSRERLIFIGVRDDINIVPSHPQAKNKPFGISIDYEFDTRLILSKEQFEKIDAHKRRQRSKGNGFGWQEVTSKEPSLAILKNMMIGGANTRLVRYKDKFRYLSSNEIMQIGAYSSRFKFINRDSMIRLVGNSVPPIFMYHIAQHIKDNILGV